MVIYKITNKINGKSYIGQTVGSLKNRWRQHCSMVSHCTAIGSAIKKYGKENFENIVLEKLTSLDEMNKREEELISLHGTMCPNGYNLHSGGRNYIASKETRRRISAALKGKKHTQESIIKMSKKHSGKKLSEDHKRKIGLAQIGRKMSPEEIRNKSNGCTNKRKIKCLNSGAVYLSLADAAKDLNLDRSSVCAVLRKRQKTINGMVFVYEDDQQGGGAR